MKLTKTAWIGTLIAKKLLLLGDEVPQTPYQVSVFRKITILLISIIKHGLYGNVSMLAKEFSCLFEMFAQNMHQKGLYQTTLSAKKASASGGLCPPDPLPSFIFQQDLIIPSHQIITNDFSWMWAIKPFR